jgi:hypothetical protein
MPLDELTAGEPSAVRVEHRPPGANGLGGRWVVSCSFAGSAWQLRWLHDHEFEADDAAAWEALAAEERERLRESAFRALEEAMLAREHRKNAAGQFRSAMRFNLALRCAIPRRASQGR